MPAGCSCNAGYSGTVLATTAAPFFVSSCAGELSLLLAVSCFSCSLSRQQQWYQPANWLQLQCWIQWSHYCNFCRAFLQWHLYTNSVPRQQQWCQHIGWLQLQCWIQRGHYSNRDRPIVLQRLVRTSPMPSKQRGAQRARWLRLPAWIFRQPSTLVKRSVLH